MGNTKKKGRGSHPGSSSLEAEADRILHEDRTAYRAIHSQQQGCVHGILSPDQLEIRAQREVLTKTGNFDLERDPGIYGRVWNPEAGKRPHKRHSDDDAAYDTRVGMNGPHGGYSDGLTPFRDPYWPQATNVHLDRYQRSRIRAEMRRVPPGHHRLRHLTRLLLADKYGVPLSVIVGLE